MLGAELLNASAQVIAARTGRMVQGLTDPAGQDLAELSLMTTEKTEALAASAAALSIRAGAVGDAFDRATGALVPKRRTAVSSDAVVKFGLMAMLAKTANEHFKARYGVDAFAFASRCVRRVRDDLREAFGGRGRTRGKGKFRGTGRRVGKK